MPEAQWYWGAVLRLDDARDALARIDAAVPAAGVHAQDPTTGHITLFYAPLRDADGATQLASRVRDDVARVPAFDLRCAGFGEFPSETRPVAWLAIAEGGPSISELRRVLCGCDEDCHRHAFVPHLTLAYGDDPAAYAGARSAIRVIAEQTELAVRIDAIWIAGFPADGHPARDLRFVERLPLADG